MEKKFGQMIDFNSGSVVFGSRFLTRQSLQNFFPSTDFIYLRQVHGVNIRSASAAATTGVLGEGDALWTRAPDKALVIQTADCLPILFWSPDGLIAAAHAGWRGVAQNIVAVVLKQFLHEGVDPKTVRAWVGPHIQSKSFEVQKDVRDKLIRSFECSAIQTETGYLVDLQRIVEHQMQKCGMDLKYLHLSREDTVQLHQRYHSYRATRAHNENLAPDARNLSFVVLNSNLC